MVPQQRPRARTPVVLASSAKGDRRYPLPAAAKSTGGTLPAPPGQHAVVPPVLPAYAKYKGFQGVHGCGGKGGKAGKGVHGGQGKGKQMPFLLPKAPSAPPMRCIVCRRHRNRHEMTQARFATIIWAIRVNMIRNAMGATVVDLCPFCRGRIWLTSC